MVHDSQTLYAAPFTLASFVDIAAQAATVAAPQPASRCVACSARQPEVPGMNHGRNCTLTGRFWGLLYGLM